MLEGRTFKNESAGTWGYHQFLALLSERYQFGSNLGVLTHKAGGDQVCHQGVCLLPGGEGGVRFLHLCHCQVTATSSMSGFLVLI